MQKLSTLEPRSLATFAWKMTRFPPTIHILRSIDINECTNGCEIVVARKSSDNPNYRFRGRIYCFFFLFASTFVASELKRSQTLFLLYSIHLALTWIVLQKPDSLQELIDIIGVRNSDNSIETVLSFTVSGVLYFFIWTRPTFSIVLDSKVPVPEREIQKDNAEEDAMFLMLWT